MAQSSGLLRGFLVGTATASLFYTFYNRITSPLIEYQEPSKSLAIPISIHDRLNIYGQPKDERRLIQYNEYSIYYDVARKQPLWVGEVITKDSITGKANRRHSKFRPDPALPAYMSSDNADFLKSGWSRGHMAPAGDFKSSQTGMDESFYLTNIIPQDFDNNSGFWNRLETHCRELLKRYEQVHVITGPLYQTNVFDGNKRYAKYEILGSNDIPVPTHLYKVVLASKSQDKESLDQLRMAAFIVPNVPITKEKNDLSRFQVDIATLEQKTGFEFFPKLDKSRVPNLCDGDSKDCTLTGWKDFEIYFAKRKLEGAQAIEQVDQIINSLKKQKISVDSNLQSLIDKKRTSLEVNGAKRSSQG